MRKFILMLTATIGILLTTAVPAVAITGDAVEDFEHPFVGVVAFFDENGDYSHRCSGSLLAPTVFLTAGHCVTTYFWGDLTLARVYFQQAALADPSQTGFPDICAGDTLGKTCATSDEFYDYDYASEEAPPWHDFPDIRDVGLVILDQPIQLPEYGVLAGDGYLDSVDTRRGQQEQTFTISGYGLTQRKPLGTNPSLERLMALSKLSNMRNVLTDGFSLRLVGNGKDRGGACNGDSGGPVLYGGYSSNIIVALSGFWLSADKVCTGNVYYYRTDRADVIDWILRTVPESERNEIQIVEA